MLFHDSHDAFYRFPLEPVATGGNITIRFWCDEGTPYLRIWDGAEQLIAMTEIGDNRWEALYQTPDFPQLVWYCFHIRRAYDVAQYGNTADGLGGIGQYYPNNAPGFQLTVYDQNYQTPEYLHHAVVYQIIPDRFYRDETQPENPDKIARYHSEAYFHRCWNEKPLLDIDSKTGDNRALDFFGGNLSGIAKKLDYLAGLGVTLLYLNPIFQARTNHRYDTGDYLEIDPIVGTKCDFDFLVAEAKKRGIRILLDGVFSHTGSDSRYFNRFGHYPALGAYQSEQSMYSDWYRFSCFPDDYKSWWGFDTLPEIDKHNPAYREFILDAEHGVLNHWIRYGACGWRLDVADELPMDLLYKMRHTLKQHSSQAALLGEVWEDASNKVSYGEMRCYCLGNTLDSVMNYPLRRIIIDFFTKKVSAAELVRLVRHQREVYPIPFFYSLMNLLGSHDRMRALNAFAGYDCEPYLQIDRATAGEMCLSPSELATAKKRYLNALRLLCALPGMPTVYYGDEIGMSGMCDPFNRAPMAWDEADATFQAEVASILRERGNKPVLQTGFLNIRTIDEDTIEISRFSVNGRDAFGSPMEANESILIRRD